MEEHYNHQENFNQFDNNEGMSSKRGWSGFVKNTWTMALTYILLGFTLARNLIKTFITVRSDASLAHFIFAVVLTILAVIVYMVIKNYLAEDLKEVPIIGVIK